MARGDMGVVVEKVNPDVEILNRIPFEGVPMTIDFTSNYSTDSKTGKKYMPAGMPIDKDGKAVKTTPFTGAVGILLHDVPEGRPQGTILKKAYINETAAEANASVTYDDTLYKLFPMIVFETGK